MTDDNLCQGEHVPEREGGVVFTEPFPTLSPREREVALRLAVGDTNRDIAESLDISIKTVDTHRGKVLKKLSCRHNVDLARLAIKMGYLPA